MGQELTVKELAAIERVDERTVRRWLDKGALEYRRTPGGSIRINSDSRPKPVPMTSSDNHGHSSR